MYNLVINFGFTYPRLLPLMMTMILPFEHLLCPLDWHHFVCAPPPNLFSLPPLQQCYSNFTALIAARRLHLYSLTYSLLRLVPIGTFRRWGLVVLHWRASPGSPPDSTADSTGWRPARPPPWSTDRWHLQIGEHIGSNSCAGCPSQTGWNRCSDTRPPARCSHSESQPSTELFLQRFLPLKILPQDRPLAKVWSCPDARPCSNSAEHCVRPSL